MIAPMSGAPSTFGKRAAPQMHAPSKPPPAPYTPAQGFVLPNGTELGLTQAPADLSLDVPEGPAESLQWSFFKACVAAYATAILLFGFVGGGERVGPDLGFVADFFNRIFISFASGVAMVSFAPVMALPARFLGDLANRIGVPRGFSDIAIGGICGSVFLLPDLMAGRLPSAFSLTFVAGGLFGGFVFWRARGYPDARGLQRQLAEGTFRLLDRGRRSL